MSREWKPGDVAALQHVTNGDFTPALRVKGGWRCAKFDDDQLHPDGAQQHLKSLRPLLVIDPEDREQALRLALAYCMTWTDNPRPETSAVQKAADQLQVALRSLLAPPRPDEPKQIAAVVQDFAGVWVRTDGPNNRPWQSNDETRGKWSHIADPTVLHHGYGGDQ